MKAIKFFAVAILFSGVSVMASAQNNATQAATASAKIVAPLTLVKSADLNFGTIATSNAVGTVTVPATSGSQASATGGASMVASSLSQTGPAVFAITGESDQTFKLNVKTGDVITLANGDETMDVTLSIPGFTATANTLTGGTRTLYIGGSLAVGANQVSGSYSKTFDVTIAYE
jgi:hypothetical protein